MRTKPIRKGDRISWSSKLHAGIATATVLSSDDSARLVDGQRVYDDAFLEVAVDGYGSGYTIHERTDGAVIEVTYSPMTFDEFLNYVRGEIGSYCTDGYWQAVYNNLQDKSLANVERLMPSMAINAIGTDSATKNG